MNNMCKAQDSKISVIVAVYNAQDYLERCVESIRKQTYENLEIVLVDDGSSDKSPQICDEYAKIDPRVKVVHKANGGLASSRNAGVSAASGTYIGFVDNDDYIREDMYETLLKDMLDNDVDLVVCNCTSVDEDGNVLDEDSPIKKTEIVSPAEYMGRLSGPKSGYYVTDWNRLYRAEILKNIVFFEGHTNEDNYAVHQIVHNCRRILILKDSYVFYTQRAGSSSRDNANYQYFDWVESIIKRIEFMEEHGYIQQIPSSVEQLTDVYIMMRRRFLFRDKKRINGIQRAGDDRKRVKELVEKYRGAVELSTLKRAEHPDYYIVRDVITGRLARLKG